MAIRWTMALWDFPPETFEAATTFWLKVTDAHLSEPYGDRNEFAALLPQGGDPYLWVQRLQSGGAAVHLDLLVDDVASEAARAEGLGAAIVREAEEGLVVVLQSPGAMTFCVVAHDGQSRRPAPARWPGGHRSAVDQLCLDVPPELYEHELGFWEQLTGRPRVPSGPPGFERLERPEGMPLELLFQRLDEAEPDRPVRARVDLACSDVEAETARHRELGAVPLERFGSWQVLRDPAGLEYRITDRVPD
ncbi:MAG TPA: VOC family protein [Glycomyces sp.]|nr:VOC family protein [Glycomyces sp.]